MTNYSQKENPFNKANPFYVPTKFTLKTSLDKGQYNFHHFNPRHQAQSPFSQQNWSFNDPHHHIPLKDTERSISDFEKLLTNSRVLNTNVHQSRTGRENKLWENPFHRKNLIIDKEKVKEQLDIDLSKAHYQKHTSESRQIYRQNLQASKYIYEYSNQLPRLGLQNENYSFASKHTSEKQSDKKRRESLKRLQESKKYIEENTEYKEEIVVRGAKFFRNIVYNKQRQ